MERKSGKQLEEWYAHELARRDKRIAELQHELDLMRKMLFKSVGEKLEFAERMKKTIDKE